MARKPKGFREGHTGNLACPHRDVTCCPQCAAKHPEIVEVYGQHFWIADQSERAALGRARDANALSRAIFGEAT